MKRGYRWIMALLALGALVVLTRGFGEEKRFAEVVRAARPAWIAAILALQVATYPCLARGWSSAIASAGAKAPSLWKLVRIALAELFTDQAVPSAGVGGILLVATALRRRGVPSRASAAAVVTSMLGFYIAQWLVVLVAGASLLFRHAFVHFAAVTFVVALVAATAIPVVAIAIAVGGLSKLPKRVQRLRAVESLREAIEKAPHEVLSPRTLVPVAAIRLVIVLLDAATLAAALAAVGQSIPFDAALAVFVLASVVGSVSFLPGGLGTFEALAAGLLTLFGVSFEAAVPAVLLMRGFSFWLPMIPGLWFARHELGARGQSHRPDALKCAATRSAESALS